MIPLKELSHLKIDEVANPVCCYPLVDSPPQNVFSIEECDLVILRGQVSRQEMYLLHCLIERFSMAPKVVGIGSCSRARVNEAKEEGCFKEIDISYVLGCPPSVRSIVHFFENFSVQLRDENVPF